MGISVPICGLSVPICGLTVPICGLKRGNMWKNIVLQAMNYRTIRTRRDCVPFLEIIGFKRAIICILSDKIPG
jgi:hypothetical protein